MRSRDESQISIHSKIRNCQSAPRRAEWRAHPQQKPFGACADLLRTFPLEMEDLLGTHNSVPAQKLLDSTLSRRWLCEEHLLPTQRMTGDFPLGAFPFSRSTCSPMSKGMELAQMSVQQLEETAKTLFTNDKGLLAMDESNPTCNKRFAQLGIPQTVEARRAYRELIVTTPRLGECIGGAILYDETIRQQTSDGTPFIKVLIEAGIIPGIKVDAGAKELAGHPGEKVTEGLDGLRDRLAEYAKMGARFAKWRAVITIGDGTPSWGSIQANAHALARYAALCQEAGLVPVVEPEVLMDGDHTLKQCYEATDEILRTVFSQLFAQRVKLEGMVLKPNMVLPGLACTTAERG